MGNKKNIFKYLIKEFHEFSIPLTYERELKIDENINKIITISGLRRTGKTFYFYSLIKKYKKKVNKNRIVYINFDDDRIFPIELKDLQDLIEAYYELYPDTKNKIIYFFLDEIQNINGWELFIRRLYDKEKIKLFITGSSSKLLKREIATSLRGRTLNFNLFTLNFKEFLRFNHINIESNYEYSNLRFKIKNLLEQFINLGGFPEIAINIKKEEKLKINILKNYYEFIVYKDLVDRFSIRNTILLKTILKYLLTNISNYFSFNSYYKTIKNEMSVSRDTIIEYVSSLMDIELIYLIPFYSYSLKVQQNHPKKIYIQDNGLRNAVAFKFSRDTGRLVENIVFLSLLRKNYKIHYWKGKNDVDFIIPVEDKIAAINVSYTDQIEEREIKGLLEFKKNFKNTYKMVIITKEVDKIDENGIEYISLFKWLIEGIEKFL